MMKKNKLNKTKKELCEICGEKMDENKFAYDYDEKNKLVFKCPACGHKKVKII